MTNLMIELRQRHAEKIEAAQALSNQAEVDDRDFTEEEQAQYDGLLRDVEELNNRIGRLEKQSVLTETLQARQAPAHLQTPRGDNEQNAVWHYIRTGDGGGLREQRASNAVAMQVGTDAEGGYAVPTGHHDNIIARRDEDALAARLGIMPITGMGTTVNVPLDAEADGEFVVSAEEADHDLDSPALGTKAMTLVRYTKKIQLSWELLEDENSNLLAFLEDFVGRGMAKTHNNLLLTEVAANGTALNTFASATAIAVDELEPIVYNDNLDPYLDGNVAWVMRASVHGEILLLDDTSIRRYGSNQMGGPGPNLLGYPILYSAKAGATAASATSVYFGNWNYVGWRDAGMMNFLRDPYSYEAGIELRYQFRTVYGVLQAEAIGYGDHPSA